MKNLILFLVKYGSFFLFIFFQLICFYLIVNYNQKQKSIYVNSSNLFAGYITQKSQQIFNFMNLDKENEALRKENSKLLQTIINNNIKRYGNDRDTTFNRYVVIGSNICGKTTNVRNNFVTLCKGLNDGLMPGMGVIDDKGIVGIIKDVSAHYASVVSILHTQSRISVALKNQNHHGYLEWDGNNQKIGIVKAIQKYASFNIGDTVVTSGYSTVFPKGLPVGTIDGFKIEPSGETFRIEVDLFSDFSSIDDVYIVESLLKEEFQTLKNEEDE